MYFSPCVLKYEINIYIYIYKQHYLVINGGHQVLREDFRFGRISHFISLSTSRFTIDLDCIMNISYQ